MNEKRILEELSRIKKSLEETRRKLVIAGTNVDFSENVDWNVLNTKNVDLQEKKSSLEKELQLLSDKNNYLAFISYENLSNQKVKKVKLTRFISSDPSEGIVSIDSPLGIALFGKKENEISRVQTDNGDYLVKVLKVEKIL